MQGLCTTVRGTIVRHTHLFLHAQTPSWKISPTVSQSSAHRRQRFGGITSYPSGATQASIFLNWPKSPFQISSEIHWYRPSKSTLIAATSSASAVSNTRARWNHHGKEGKELAQGCHGGNKQWHCARLHHTFQQETWHLRQGVQIVLSPSSQCIYQRLYRNDGNEATTNRQLRRKRITW